MPEFPDDVLVGVDRSRPLPSTLRRRLEEALLAVDPASRPLGEELSARLEDELADPLGEVFAGIDGPRPLRRDAHEALARTLARPERRRAPRLTAVAATVVVLAGAGIGLAVSRGAGSGTSSSQASRPPRQATSGPAGHRFDVAGPVLPPAGGGAGASGGQADTSAGPAQLAPVPAAAGAAPVVTGVSPDSGPAAGGTWVTITGTELTPATAVRFGASEATTFVVVSGTDLRAQAPTHGTGPVDVTVTGPAGTSQTGPADLYRYD